MEYVACPILKDNLSNDRKSISMQKTVLGMGVNAAVVKGSKLKIEILRLNLIAYVVSM